MEKKDIGKHEGCVSLQCLPKSNKHHWLKYKIALFIRRNIFASRTSNATNRYLKDHMNKSTV